MAYWLYMHANFAVLDAVTAFIPLSFLPFFVLTWAITNVTSALYPVELSAGFYRVGFALPGHELYAILFQIWSGGCNNQLYRALPILFAWEVVGVILAIVGMLRRNKKAKAEALLALGNNQVDSVAKRSTTTLDDMEQGAQPGDGPTAGPGLPMPFIARRQSRPIES